MKFAFIFSGGAESFQITKTMSGLLNVWRTIDPLLGLISDGIISKSRKCGRESEKIVENILLIWLISLNFSQPVKILKYFLCFRKLSGNITPFAIAIIQLSSSELVHDLRILFLTKREVLSLVAFCLGNWKDGADIVLPGSSVLLTPNSFSAWPLT